MQEVLLTYFQNLKNPGDTLNKTGKVNLEGYKVGEKHYELKDGLSYDVIATHTGEGILLTGIVSAQAQSECDRCLEPAHFEISGEVEGYYLFSEPDPEFDLEEDEFELVKDEEDIDISGALEQALIMDTPYVLLCQDDCEGLCPVCGINLNEHPGHNHDGEIDEQNPFAQLKNLKFDQ